MTTKKQQSEINGKVLLKQAQDATMYMCEEFSRVHPCSKPLKISKIKIYSSDMLQGEITFYANFFSETQLRDFEIICPARIYSFFVYSTHKDTKINEDYAFSVDINFSIRGDRPQTYNYYNL